MNKPIPGIFHPVGGMTLAARASGNVREFVGDGTAHIPVSGLKELKSLQVGSTPIPLERDYKFPLSSDFAQKVFITLPHAGIVEGPDGEPVLVRSIHSNDGIWQKDVKVFVGGDWDDEPSSIVTAGEIVTVGEADEPGAKPARAKTAAATA